jgi:transcriptional regulator with XRE-family HTH domain
VEAVNGPEGAPQGIGETLRQARVAQGLSLHSLAFDLNLSVHLLEAIEAEAWDRLPPGRERPYTRQIADRLGVDPEAFAEQWNRLPGALEQEPPDPRREHLERILMGALTAGTILLVLWLVVPGRNLRKSRVEAAPPAEKAAPARWLPAAPEGPYPVVGEVLPEVPVNDEGILVSMRAQDTCEVTLARDQDPAAVQKRSLRISEPWRLRVKGPFSVTLDNGGVVVLDVAGRRIRLGAAVGEPWTGRFGENGDLILPETPVNKNPPTAPETDQEGE